MHNGNASNDLRKRLERVWEEERPVVEKFGFKYDVDRSEVTTYGIDVPVIADRMQGARALDISDALDRLQHRLDDLLSEAGEAEEVHLVLDVLNEEAA